MDGKVDGQGTRPDGPDRVTLFAVTAAGELHVATRGAPVQAQPGDTVVAIEATASG